MDKPQKDESDNVVHLFPPTQPESTVPKTHMQGGKCTECGEDLNDLVDRHRQSGAPLPRRCRGCGREFLEPMTVTVYRCGGCHSVLTFKPPQPQRERFCSTCGAPLNYEAVENDVHNLPNSQEDTKEKK